MAAVLAAALAIGGISIPAEAEVDPEAITQEDFLKAEGKNIYTRSGELMQLKGSNAGGYLVQEPWMSTLQVTGGIVAEMDMYRKLTERFGEKKMREIVKTYQEGYWTEEDFDHCKALGMNCIRLPFWFMNLVDFEGNLLDDAFDRIDWFVEEAGKRGLYVILDMHGAPGSQNASDHSGIDGGSQKQERSEFFFGPKAKANQEKFYELWETIAARYKGNPVVAGYDLMNEPYCTYRYNTGYSDEYLHTMLWDIYDEAYGRIRAIDPDHIIIMEATWNPVDLPDPYAYGWENVMYQYHQYEYSDYDNAEGKQVAGIQNKVNSIINANYNVPSYIGEFCLMSNTEAWSQGLKILNEAGLSWTTWTFKGIRTGTTAGQNWCQYFLEDGSKVDVTSMSYEELIARWTDNGGATQNPAEGFAEAMESACTEPAHLAASPDEGERYLAMDGGVDIEKYDGRLEAEFCQPSSGTFSSYNISTGEETVDGETVKYVQWDAKDWGNAKWIVYIRQAGTYEVTARMKVTQSGDSNFKFGIGTEVTGDGTTNTTIDTAVTDGYQDVTVGTITIGETGLHGVKIMDGNGNGGARVKMNLDYLQFTLRSASGEHDDREELVLTGIRLSKDSVSLTEGQVLKLKATPIPSQITDAKFYWSSSNRSVASVTGGTVQALRPGNATITVRAQSDPEKIKAVCEVEVLTKEPETKPATEPETEPETEPVAEPETEPETEPVAEPGTEGEPQTEAPDVKIPVQSVDAGQAAVNLKVGGRYQIPVKVAPSNASGYRIEFSSSNTKAAVVDAKGFVTAKGAGTATITVTVLQPNGTRKLEEVLVSVSVEKNTVKKVTGLKVKNQKNGKVKLTWKKLSGVSGYQIYRSPKKSKGFKKIAEAGASKKAYIDKKAGKKTVYYKIRAYKISGGQKIYGAYTKAVKRTGK